MRAGLEIVPEASARRIGMSVLAGLDQLQSRPQVGRASLPRTARTQKRAKGHEPQDAPRICRHRSLSAANSARGEPRCRFFDARVRRCQSSQMTDSADDTARNVPRNCPVRQSARGCRDRASPATMTVAGAGFSMPLPGQATTRTGATRRFPRRSRPEMKNARHWAGRFHQQIFGKRPSPGPA